MLKITEKYSDSVFKLLKIMEKKIIKTDAEKFDKIFDIMKDVSEHYEIKTRYPDQFKKEKENYVDEELVASAYCLALKEPVHLVSLDHDVLYLCRQLWKEKSSELEIPRYPVYLHTYDNPKNIGKFGYKEKFFLIPHKSQASLT